MARRHLGACSREILTMWHFLPYGLTLQSSFTISKSEKHFFLTIIQREHTKKPSDIYSKKKKKILEAMWGGSKED